MVSIQPTLNLIQDYRYDNQYEAYNKVIPFLIGIYKDDEVDPYQVIGCERTRDQAFILPNT